MSQMSVVWMCVAVCVLECCWCVCIGCQSLTFATVQYVWHSLASQACCQVADILPLAQQQQQQAAATAITTANSNSPTTNIISRKQQQATGNRQQAGKSNSVHQLIALVANRLADANIVGNTMPCATSATCAAQTGKRTDWQFCSAAFSNIFRYIFHIYVYGQQQQLLIDCRQSTSVVAVAAINLSPNKLSVLITCW